MGPSLWYHCGNRTWLGSGCGNFCFQTSFVKGTKPERRFVPLWMVKVQHMSAETADSAAEFRMSNCNIFLCYYEHDMFNSDETLFIA
jgi:hypothetical protein